MTVLSADWRLCVTPANAWATPEHIDPQASWVPAQVPGTAAQALQAAGLFDPRHPQPLHQQDVWYQTTITGHGTRTLVFEGLATVAEVHLDGQLLAQQVHMFAPLQADVTLGGTHRLHLVFRSLHHHLQGLKLPRARWRVAMAEPANLRAVRTTLLGHMPSWCPPIDIVGPWLPIREVRPTDWFGVTLSAHCPPGDPASPASQPKVAQLRVKLRCKRNLTGWRVGCHNAEAQLQPDPAVADGWMALCSVTAPPLWWPRGYGPQHLLDVTLHPPAALPDNHNNPGLPQNNGQTLGRVGFRSLEPDLGPDGRGFGLRVNGVAVFARGATFTPAQLQHPADDTEHPRRLRTLASLGVNMVRLAGPFCYQTPAFFHTCDELGILVWQDLMLANFDYPFADPAFAAAIHREWEAQIAPRAGHPSLAVLCGGSEMHQQAAMLGLPPERRSIHFLEQEWPAWCAENAPGALNLPNTPWGGVLPFSVREGVSHCFGVGAYERPLADARRTAPRFAAECLALAHVPEPISLQTLPVSPVHHPDWKAGVPRDRHASWDFEDTRDHYLAHLFGTNPQALRRVDPTRYLALSRAVSAHVLHQTLAEWRSPACPTRGALVFTAADLQPGAGWGLLAHDGEPKAAAWGLAHASQPQAILLTDEGNDGLDIHLINDTPHPAQWLVHVHLLQHGRQVVAQGQRATTVSAHGCTTLNATDVLGAFADVTYAFRFGPPAHDAVVVWATQTDGQPPTDGGLWPLEAVHFPQGLDSEPTDLHLRTQLTTDADGHWWLTLHCGALARFVHIQDAHHRPSDNHFHLLPGRPRTVRLEPRCANGATPKGLVTALNAWQACAYGDTP